MKHAYISDHRNGNPLYQDGKKWRMPIYRFLYLYRDERGWRLNIFAFVRGVTDNFKLFSMQGVFVLGHYDGKWFVEFCPHTDPVGGN